MKIHFILLLLFTGVFTAHSQSDSLKGKINETFSGQSLAFVHITVQPSADEYVCDIDG
ncbi:MAG: hypothetical protein H7259_05275, partial [Cytophagales bacterium]|nr:hypothetical protein [Cytophaga sp.]